ncbi:hypothetical protein ACN20G_16615 [Streptomyces sp. BI20]
MNCEFCGSDDSDVEVRLDPVDWEVNDEEWYVAMCDDCEQMRADEV